MAFVLVATCARATDGAAEGKVKIDDKSFKCMTDMTPVRHFYVDNLLGNLKATVAVAKAGKGDYPEGSVVQLMPNEVMIKQQKGFSPPTRDWEFFWIDVDKDGSKIFRRGFVDVNNRFDLNCFACHVKAQPAFDFICEQGHGGDPIPVTRAMFGALQRTDPRCKHDQPASAEDKQSLKLLGEVVAALKASEEVKRSRARPRSRSILRLRQNPKFCGSMTRKLSVTRLRRVTPFRSPFFRALNESGYRLTPPHRCRRGKLSWRTAALHLVRQSKAAAEGNLDG